MIVAVIDSFQVRRGAVSGLGGSTFLKQQHSAPPLPGGLHPKWLIWFSPPCPGS